MASSEIILVRPEEIGKGRAFFYRDKIINEMRKAKELDVIGITNAISLTCSAVRMSLEIAGIYVQEMCLDYIPLPILSRVSAIFFALGLEPKPDWEVEKAKLEKDMKLDFDREGQLVVVSRKLSPEQMVPLCLSKLSHSDRLKVAGSGFWINRTATLALEITKGSISKGPVAIELMGLSTAKFSTPDGEKSTTILEIFLKAGKTTEYSPRHHTVISKLKKVE